MPPGKPRTAVVAVAAAAVAAVVSAVVTAGVATGTEAEPAPTVTVTKTAAAVDDGATPADDESPPAPEDSDDGVYALDDTVVYETDAEVSLSGFERSVTGEYGEPGNTSYLRFTVKLHNGGSTTFDSTQLTVNCSYGQDGRSSESVFDSDAGLEGGPETKLLAGRSLNVPWGCALPKNQKLVQIEVTPDFESDAAIFTGTVG
ncbi:hypothetical protein ACF1BE_22090 [Streptomyces sp. NPDC014991]|uniref:hypothetical protein n=1 Tax=Streptomyces sp. NPDC014991 TaxID=3364935 RepID=UPI0036F5E460